MIDRFERFSFAISEVSRCWHKLAAEEMEKYGLKGSHAVYLTTLYRYPKGLTVPKLCELCGRDKSDASRMLALMEQKGLIQKEGTNQKRYRGTLTLTEEGRKAAEFVRERASLAVELAGKGLTDEKRSIFYEALGMIVCNLQEISKEGLSHYESNEKSILQSVSKDISDGDADSALS